MSEANDWTIPGFLEVRDGVLHIDGVSAIDLAKEHETPLFVFSEKRIRHNIARLKEIQHVTDRPLKICYAAKAMSTMGILRAVRDAGIDIEVNSGGELWKALKAGFTGDQIIFNGTSKEVRELEMAIENEIYAIQVDSLYELSLIEETAKGLAKTAKVSLRLVPEIESGTHSGLQTALLTSKFGMMPDEAFVAFKAYKDSEHVKIEGIHLHIGSQNPKPEVYTQALEMLAENLLRAYSELGVRLSHINLGGGFPVDYSRGSVYSTIPERLESFFVDRMPEELRMRLPATALESLREQLKTDIFRADYTPAEALASAWSALSAIQGTKGESDLLDGITLLLEPGRSIIADAGICLTTVRNKKERPRHRHQNPEHGMTPGQVVPSAGIGAGNSVTFGIYDLDEIVPAVRIPDTITWLLTDAGFNIMLSMVTYSWYYHLISASRSGEEHRFPYKVAGPLCDGGDVYFDIDRSKGGRLPGYRMLPEGVEPGEVLALLNCGAYSLAQGMQYNGRFLPAVVLIRQNGTTELIRKRDTFEDLINNDL